MVLLWLRIVFYRYYDHRPFFAFTKNSLKKPFRLLVTTFWNDLYFGILYIELVPKPLFHYSLTLYIYLIAIVRINEYERFSLFHQDERNESSETSFSILATSYWSKSTIFKNNSSQTSRTKNLFAVWLASSRC